MSNLELTDLDPRLLNPRWRLENLYRIIDKRGAKIRFKLNNIQAIIEKCDKKRQRILKARQFGISTYKILKLFDDTIWNENRTNVILAHEDDAIKKLFRIVARAYKFLGQEFSELQPRLERGGGSQYEYYFPEINSRIYCDLQVRGDTISKLHVSEAAFIKDVSRLKATLEAVPLWGEVTQETTPNGIGNHFYEAWQEQDPYYANLFFPWYFFKEYQLETVDLEYTEEEQELISKAKKLFDVAITKEQIAFRRFKKKENRELFLQEYPEDDQTCFLASGEAAFDLITVSELIQKLPKPIEHTGDEKCFLKIFERYNSKKRYVCGADTAEGKDGDYSVATIYEARSRRQVAILRGQYRPFDFANKINELCSLYTREGSEWPLLAVEKNNHGHAVLLQLEHHVNDGGGYPNLFYHDTEKKIPGWLTDKVTRPIMINTFRDGVENNTIVVNDRMTLGECLTLVVNNGKIEAAEGKHDDCVIASAIALQMCLSMVDLDSYENIDKMILL